MVASENGPFSYPPGDEAALAARSSALAARSAPLRARSAQANRAKARAEYDEAAMIERYRALYWGADGPAPLGPPDLHARFTCPVATAQLGD